MPLLLPWSIFCVPILWCHSHSEDVLTWSLFSHVASHTVFSQSSLHQVGVLCMCLSCYIFHPCAVVPRTFYKTCDRRLVHKIHMCMMWYSFSVHESFNNPHDLSLMFINLFWFMCLILPVFKLPHCNQVVVHPCFFLCMHVVLFRLSSASSGVLKY